MTKRFDDELRQLVLFHAGEPLAHCGELVTTLWGNWKKEHHVMIYKVEAALVSLNGNRRARNGDESNKEYEEYMRANAISYMGVELHYGALRLGRNGIPKEKYGIHLTNFKTEDGYKYQLQHDDFNHVGLSFAIEEIPEEDRCRSWGLTSDQ